MAGLDESLVRELFQEAMSRSGAYGAQLSIVMGGEQLDLAAGVSDARHGTFMATNTLMQIGSITKIFNVAILMTLVDEGLLALDNPIQAYAPLSTATHDALHGLTLRHLLSMSSGLDNGPYLYFGRDDDALARYVDGLDTLPRHFAPGTHFGYSNAGACIAGWVASKVTGLTWERLLQERILTPARLDSAATSDAAARHRALSVGHVRSPDSRMVQIVEPLFDDLRSRAPSGPSFALSTSDLARFATIFGRSGISDTGTRLLSVDAVDQMHVPQIATPSRKYGTAWCVGPCTGMWDEYHVWGHGGTSPTATSYLYWIPEQQGVIAFVVNTHAAMAVFSEIVFSRIVQAAFGCSKPPIGVPDPPGLSLDYRRYVGRYEEVGTVMEVHVGKDGELRAHLVPRRAPGERSRHRTEQHVVLRPLGGDRFLNEPVDGPDGHRGAVDTAFFGSDEDGRATNALNLVFPMSRVSS